MSRKERIIRRGTQQNTHLIAGLVRHVPYRGVTPRSLCAGLIDFPDGSRQTLTANPRRLSFLVVRQAFLYRKHNAFS